jgi:hypothetical protein
MKIKTLLLSALIGIILFPDFVQGAYALVSNTIAGSTDQDNVTTSSINTTGANVIIIAASYFSVSGGVTPTDNKSNTWNQLTDGDSTDAKMTMFYCYNCIVGTGHTFSYSDTASYPVLAVVAFSGGPATDPFDQQNNNAVTSGTSLSTNGVTPTENNELVVTGLSLASSPQTASINSSFIISNQLDHSPGEHMFGALAYKIQTSAGAENPTWSWTTSTYIGTTVATFKAAAAATTARRIPIIFQ